MFCLSQMYILYPRWYKLYCIDTHTCVFCGTFPLRKCSSILSLIPDKGNRGENTPETLDLTPVDWRPHKLMHTLTPGWGEGDVQPTNFLHTTSKQRENFKVNQWGSVESGIGSILVSRLLLFLPLEHFYCIFMQELWRNCSVLKHRHHFSKQLANLSTYPVLKAISLATISSIILIIVQMIFSSSSGGRSSGDAIDGAVHMTRSQAGAAAGWVKGVWLEPLTVMIHSGGWCGDHGERARCVSGFGGAKLNWNMVYCRRNLISQEALEGFSA